MIVTLLLCVLLCAALGLFVVAPLARSGFEGAGQAILKGFSDEEELRQALLLRDALFARLIDGSSTEPAVASLGESEAMDALVALCERLRNSEFPFLPSASPVPAAGAGSASRAGQSGRASTGGVVTLLCVSGAAIAAAAVSGALPGSAVAQPMAPSETPPGAPGAPPGTAGGTGAGSQAPANPHGGQGAPDGDSGAALTSRIPGPIPMEGLQWAPLHQYVLSPRMGQLHVYYLGVFNNVEGLSEGRMGLPLPEGFEELKFTKMPDSVVEPASKPYPVLRMPLRPGVNQIRAEFVISAATGVARWKGSGVPALPGTTVVLMPEYQGVLRKMTEGVFPSLNVWPPRILDLPSDFRSELTREEHDPTDPNYALLVRMPPEFTRNAVRSATAPAAFPSFEVAGLVPTRVPLYALGGLFASFLFGTAAFTMSRHARAGRAARGGSGGSGGSGGVGRSKA